MGAINSLFSDHSIKILQSKKIPIHHKRVLLAIAKCRTKYLGGRKLKCLNCSTEKIVYNSCRNRHCPQCQTTNREKWIMARENDLLDVKYFHVVFTLPSELNSYALKHPKAVYNALFTASWQTLKAFAADKKHLGAKPRMTCILHTWGQNLSLHPHLHCIVPGGGLLENGEWKNALGNGKFLFPVKAMSAVFRAKYVAELRRRLLLVQATLDQKIAKILFTKDWVVYAKRPFASPKNVIEYLGRYSHKVAISNSRIIERKKQLISFHYKDYRDKGRKKVMKLKESEFIRRYAMHILPSRFMRIRHYGILSSSSKKKDITKARKSIAKAAGLTGIKSEKWSPSVNKGWVDVCKERLGFDPEKCPKCKQKTLVNTGDIAPVQRGPPEKQNE